jgi:hypothetical protein
VDRRSSSAFRGGIPLRRRSRRRHRRRRPALSERLTKSATAR